MPLNLPDIPPPDRNAFELAFARQNSLTKPPGSLGRLEEIACAVAAMQGDPIPSFDRKIIVVAAADHGVVEEGVSAYPSEVTAQMMQNFLSGGAAINVLARQARADVMVVDAGVTGDIPESDRLVRAALARGARNIARGPAMPREHAEEIVARGVKLGASLAEQGRVAVVPGDMGIGNTTASAAITAVLTGKGPAEVAGPGTGVSGDALRRKIQVIERAIEVNDPQACDPLDVLAKVGGYEIGFLAGVMLGAASCRGTVIVDGFISTAAALIATGLDGSVRDYMLAGHRSAEPGHDAALAHLGMEPILGLKMRLGEGTGAALALQVVDSALALHAQMATFAEAGVSGAEAEDK